MSKLLSYIFRIEKSKYHIIVSFLFFKLKIRTKQRQDNNSVEIIELPKIKLKNIGKQSYGCEDIYITSPNTSIGAFCSIGPRVILGHGEHPVNYLSTSPYFYFDELAYKKQTNVSHPEYWNLQPINIGNDVWIGDGVFVKNGITVGDGAIIGARSVVTKDIPPYAIVVGCPAKIIRYRFDEKTIEELLKLRWWDLDDEIIKNIPYDNINDAIKFLKGIRNIK